MTKFNEPSLSDLERLLAKKPPFILKYGNIIILIFFLSLLISISKIKMVEQIPAILDEIQYTTSNKPVKAIGLVELSIKYDDRIKIGLPVQATIGKKQIRGFIFYKKKNETQKKIDIWIQFPDKKYQMQENVLLIKKGSECKIIVGKQTLLSSFIINLKKNSVIPNTKFNIQEH